AAAGAAEPPVGAGAPGLGDVDPAQTGATRTSLNPARVFRDCRMRERRRVPRRSGQTGTRAGPSVRSLDAELPDARFERGALQPQDPGGAVVAADTPVRLFEHRHDVPALHFLERGGASGR